MPASYRAASKAASSVVAVPTPVEILISLSGTPVSSCCWDLLAIEQAVPELLRCSHVPGTRERKPPRKGEEPREGTSADGSSAGRHQVPARPGMVETRGIEPLTPALQRRCSAN